MGLCAHARWRLGVLDIRCDVPDAAALPFGSRVRRVLREGKSNHENVSVKAPATRRCSFNERETGEGFLLNEVAPVCASAA